MLFICVSSELVEGCLPKSKNASFVPLMFRAYFDHTHTNTPTPKHLNHKRTHSVVCDVQLSGER